MSGSRIETSDSRHGWGYIKEPDDQSWHRVYIRYAGATALWGWDEEDDPEVLPEGTLIQMPDYVTIKLYADTRRLLRLIAAQSGEQMVQVMQRLCENEWSRLDPKSTNDSSNDLDRNKKTAERRITKP